MRTATADAAAPPTSSANEWKAISSVRRRNRRRRVKRRDNESAGGTDARRGSASVLPPARPMRDRTRGGNRSVGTARRGRSRGLPRRPPRTAAVAITCEEGGPSYAETLRKARERVSLEDLNIERTRIRRAATGAVLIEIPSEKTKDKADELAKRLQLTLADIEVKVTRPMRMGKIRISGLDDSFITSVDVALAIGKVGNVSWLDIKTSEIRCTQRGMGTL